MSSPPTRADSTSPPTRAESFSGSPGRTSSPGKSLRNRMQNAMRRASTGLSIATKPTLSRSSSKNSLKPDSQTPAAPSDLRSAPSPVAESPAREAAATAEEIAASAPLGPSPLANVIAAGDPTPEATPTQASAPVLTATPAPEQNGLAQITASPEQVPVVLPSQVPASAPVSFGFSDPVLPVPSQPAVPPQDAPVIAAKSDSRAPEPTSLPAPAQPDVPKAVEERPADYFSFRDPVAPVTKAPTAEAVPVEQPTIAIAPPSLEAVPVVEAVPAQDVSHIQHPTDTSTFAWSDEPALRHKASRSSLLDLAQHTVDPTHSDMPSGKVSTRASRSSMSSSYGQILPEQRRGRSSSVRVSMDDPFADQFAGPPMTLPTEVPKQGLSPVASVAMPEPHPSVDIEADDDDEHVHESPTPISYPLPPMRDVIGAQSNRTATSAYILGERDGASLAGSVHRDIDERVPLLQHAAPLGHGGTAKSTPSRGKTAHIVATFASGPITTELATSQTLQTLGWSEYVLPDSSYYYHHAAMRVTTDIDLRNPRYLQHVTEYLEKQLPRDTTMPPPQDWELWIKSGAVKQREVHKIQQSWVNHKLRIITSDPPPTISGEGLIMERFSDDDKLDMEYRYWGFIEGHPAHVSIATETHTEAMDALKWSYTDCLLPSARPAPPPFAPQECQELMNLLRSFDNTSGNALVVQTRVVSRVLLRVAQWRQMYFRPNKPLPKDAIKGVKEHRTPFGRAVLDFIIGCLCLGIPYIFLSRSHHQSFDEESGLYSAGPMLMVSACACLVAAVILSASVTFLSLPQLDDVPRLAGFLAIAFSASSMVSAVVALLRYKAEIDRSVVYLGGEGLMVLSRRSVIFSLPLVFLAWAIAAFMTGITLYSFRGATVSSRIQVRHPFEPYTHWAVVGTLGALGGMLTIAAMFGRR